MRKLLTDKGEINDRNFENLVHFYSGKLKSVKKGRSAFAVFSARERNRLTDYGIIAYNKQRKMWMVSEKAEKILKKLT